MSLSKQEFAEYVRMVNEAGYSVIEIGRIRFGRLAGLGEAKARAVLFEIKHAFAADPSLTESVPPKVMTRRVTETVTIAEEHRLKKENRELRQQLKEALDGQERNAAYESFIAAVSESQAHNEKWRHTSRKGGGREARPVAPFSDAHFDEWIDPAQINFVNAYNREIAELRLKTYFHNLIELSREYLSGFTYTGIHFPMMGDIFSGDIHEELSETNEATTVESVLYWLGPMESGIQMLADEFGEVTIPVVVGNHPRRTKKPRHKLRVRDNFDWLFACLLQRHFAKDKRINFYISESSDCDFKIYDWRFTMTHGDQFRGGSGIAGLLSPMMIGDARKRKRARAVKRDYDYLLMGHWHQYLQAQGVIINGSLKGYDEYAFDSNFGFEPPRQTLFIVDPKHGVTITAPVHVQSKEEMKLWPKARP